MPQTSRALPGRDYTINLLVIPGPSLISLNQTLNLFFVYPGRAP